MSRLVLIALLLCPIPMAAHSEEKAQSTPIAITNVTVIDCTGKDAQPEVTVIINGDRISSIGKAGEITVPKDASIIDGKGKFLIPGLWDMHVHWYDTPYLPLFTANGVTGVRVMWGFPLNLKWRKDINAGTLHGPRLVIAGSIVDGPKPIWPG